MATLLFANNIQTTLATSITGLQTSVTLASTAGLPSPTSGQYFVMTFTNGNTNEIVWVTAVSGSTITVLRGKEGTGSTSFPSGSYASCFPTAGTQQDFIQIDQLQNGAYTFANGAGTANALTATIASNLTASALPNGFQFVINAANANTSSATLNLTLNPTLPGSGATTSTDALPIYKNGNSLLSGGEITGSNYLCLFTFNANYNGGAGAFVLENPYNAVTGVVGITQLQSEYFIYSTAGGSTDALTLTVPAGLSTLTDGATVTFRNTVAVNATTTPTLQVTYGSTATAATVIKKYAGVSLSAGDTGGVGYICQLVYSSSASAWMLLNPAPGVAGGVTSITAGSGIFVSSPSGAVTINNTGVTSVNGSSGTVTVSTTSISALSTTTSPDQTVASHVYFAQNIYPYAVVCTGTGAVFPAFQVTGGGYYGFLTPSSLQLATSGTGLTSDGAHLTMIVANAVGFSIDGSGNGTITNNLTVEYGTGYKPGGGSWAIYSDARLKDNIEPLTGALAKLLELNPVSYSWNYKNNEPTVGFIAQEVQKVLPNSVVTAIPLEDQKPFITDNEVLGIGWQNDMTAYLVGAIKELNLKQVELETKINIQAAYIAALQAKV